jgi:hypothetical protein
MSDKTKRSKKVEMTDGDLLAMYRCFLYTKMSIKNDEPKPSDKQCLDWLQVVMAQAEHRIEPPLFMRIHPDVICAPIPNTQTKTSPAICPIVRRFDMFCALPDWRESERPPKQS